MKGLGERIKSLRVSRGLTLVGLATATQIDQATLSRIENGRMTGTLASHMKIAEALGLRLPDLYEQTLNVLGEAKEKELRKKIETFSHSSGAVAELLTQGILQKKMMPILLKLKPGGRTENEEYASPAERFAYVLKGSVEITVGEDKKRLEPGERLYFNASLPHHFRNASRSECWCLSIMTPASL